MTSATGDAPALHPEDTVTVNAKELAALITAVRTWLDLHDRGLAGIWLSEDEIDSALGAARAALGPFEGFHLEAPT